MEFLTAVLILSLIPAIAFLVAYGLRAEKRWSMRLAEEKRLKEARDERKCRAWNSFWFPGYPVGGLLMTPENWRRFREHLEDKYPDQLKHYTL